MDNTKIRTFKAYSLTLHVWLSLSLLLVAQLASAAEPQVGESRATEINELKPFSAGTFDFVQGSHQAKPSYAFQMISAALAENGYAMQLQHFPGRRLPVQLNNGEIDGAIGLLHDLSNRFENTVRVREPIRRICALIYGLADNPLEITTEAPLKVGILAAAREGQRLTLERWPNVQLVFYENLQQGVRQLEHGRIDAIGFIGMQQPALQTMITRPLTLLDSFDLPYIYLHLNKQHSQLADKLTKSLVRLKQQNPEPQCEGSAFPRQLNASVRANNNRL